MRPFCAERLFKGLLVLRDDLRKPSAHRTFLGVCVLEDPLKALWFP